MSNAAHQLHCDLSRARELHFAVLCDWLGTELGSRLERALHSRLARIEHQLRALEHRAACEAAGAPHLRLV